MHEFFVRLWHAIIDEILGPRQHRVENLSEQEILVSIKDGDYRSVWTVIKVESWRARFLPLSHRTQYFSLVEPKDPPAPQGFPSTGWREINNPGGDSDEAITQAIALTLGMQGYRDSNEKWKPLPIKPAPHCKERWQ